jgi:CDP-6-deoxy-D-xylo-4-hexulose-3-dehydrase
MTEKSMKNNLATPKVPLSVFKLRKVDISNVTKTLKSGNLTMGEQVSKFEKLFANYVKSKHFIMTNSGSSANLLIFEYLLRPSNGKPLLKLGDGVIVPAIAWPTSVWPIIQLGLIPIFVDVNKETFDLNLESARASISKTKIPIKAIFPIHPLGYAINPRKLKNFADEFSLILINDVCESLGSWKFATHAGRAGLAATFSFYFSHHITTMEGGGIATDSDEMADDLRAMRSHGWSRDRRDRKFLDTNNNIPKPDSKFQFITTGYNVRPTEINASIGIKQISKIDLYVEQRRQLVYQVAEAIKEGPLRVNSHKNNRSILRDVSNSWMMIPLTLDSHENHKVEIQDYLESKGIETRPVLTGNFLDQPVFRTLKNYISNVSLANTKWISRKCFLIGAHHAYSKNQISYLVKILKNLSNSYKN